MYAWICYRLVALGVDTLDQVANHHYWLKRYIEMNPYTQNANVFIQEDRLWIRTVPRSLIESMTKDEIRRQENIYELIYTEKDFVDDLMYLKNVSTRKMSNLVIYIH